LTAENGSRSSASQIIKSLLTVSWSLFPPAFDCTLPSTSNTVLCPLLSGTRSLPLFSV